MSWNETIPFAEGLERLKSELASGSPPPEEPRELARRDILMAHSVFQPRMFDGQVMESEAHVVNLKAAILAQPNHLLEPITIWWSGRCWRCLDGNHRLLAYERLAKDAKRPVNVERLPVVVFRGSLSEAIVEATRANSNDKLNMSLSDKRERAWKLTALQEPGLSIPAIAKATGVGERTVSNMRAELKKIIDAKGPEEGPKIALETLWGDVLKDRLGARSFDEEREEKIAREWARRLAKALGKQPSKQPDVFLKALRIWSPHLLKRLEQDIVADANDPF